MKLLRKGLLIVRNLDDSDGGPSIPESWSKIEEDNSWWSVYGADKTLYSIYKANENASGTKGLFLILSENIEKLRRIAQVSDDAFSLKQAWSAIGSNNRALSILRRWPVYRVSGMERGEDGSVFSFTAKTKRLIHNMSDTLPNPRNTPLPWNLNERASIVTAANAKIRIESILYPSIDVTMAGYDDVSSAEETEDYTSEE